METRDELFYSEDFSFETPAPVKPEVITKDITKITASSAESGGIITDDGGEVITSLGICWDSLGSPDINSWHTEDTIKGDEFTSALTNLSCGTVYYLRAYTENIAGISYGDTISFKTPDCEKIELIVSTSEISNVTDTTAECGGNVIHEGGAAVTIRGVCWSQSPQPEITDSHTEDGSGIGSFTSALTGLSGNSLYYIRAYATNSEGTSYGEQFDFTTDQTPIIKPRVSTSGYNYLTETSVQVNGNVTDEGGGVVSDRGVCWSKSPDPEITDSVTPDGSGAGSYTSVITGLRCNTRYYARAYATNSAGTSYGEQLDFKTDICTSVTDIENNRYDAVKIGQQVWMAENLRVTQYPDGTEIDYVADSADWAALGTTNAAYCWYDNVEANSEIFGALYNWTAAMYGKGGSNANPSGVQGVCPDGWHLPSDDEWKQLEMVLGLNQAETEEAFWRGTNQGIQLKEKGFVHWLNAPEEGTNSRGFTALGAGDRRYQGWFEGIRMYTYYWTASEYNMLHAWDRHLSYTEGGIHRKDNNKGHGLSVRCVMDE